MVTTGIKPSSNIGNALVSAMYGRSSELGLYLWGNRPLHGGQVSISLDYHTYTSAHPFVTLVTGLDTRALPRRSLKLIISTQSVRYVGIELIGQLKNTKTCKYNKYN